MKDRVIEIVSSIAKLEVAVLENETTETLWDSLTHLEIILALEDEFHVSFVPEDIAMMRTITAIVEILLRIMEEQK